MSFERTTAVARAFLFAQVIPCPTYSQEFCDYAWNAPIPGRIEVRGATLSTYWDPDGAGPLTDAITVVGITEIVGWQASPRAAYFDGSAWISISPGLEPISQFWNLCIWNNALVCSGRGSNDSDHRVLVWTGASWQQIATLNQRTTGVVSYGGGLFIAGGFSLLNDAPTSSLARWDGFAWSQVSNVPVLFPRAIATHADSLIVTGQVTSFDERVIRWDGVQWTDLTPLSVNGPVSEMKSAGGQLFIRGPFTVVNGENAGGVASFDGDDWQAATWPTGDSIELPVLGYTGVVHVAEPLGDDLIVGGEFADIGGATARNLARFDGTSWREFGGGANGPIRDLIARPGTLVAIGDFSEIGGVALQGSAAWSGQTWIAFGDTRHLILDADRIFRKDGDQVFRWTGTEWVFERTTASPCGDLIWIFRNETYASLEDHESPISSSSDFVRERDGVCLKIRTLSWFDRQGNSGGTRLLNNFEHGLIYVDSRSRSYGGYVSESLGGWNGDAAIEMPIGTFTGGPAMFTHYPNLNSVARVGGNWVYGGEFQHPSIAAQSYILQWNGRYSRALGSGVNGPIRRLRTWRDKVVALGDFSSAGGLTVPGFAIYGCPADCTCDGDEDGVADQFDQCPGADDRLDEDENGIPDCLERNSENNNSNGSTNSNSGGGASGNANNDGENLDENSNDDSNPDEDGSREDAFSFDGNCGSCGGASPLLMLPVALALLVVRRRVS